MAITFYYSPMSSATRVTWALEEIGMPFEKVRIHLDKGEQKKPEYLAINPNGKVPALVDGDGKMFESLAIILHLGEKYGVAKGLWPKEGSNDRGEALSWTVWALAEVQPQVVAYISHTSDRSFAFPKDQRHPPTVDAATKAFDRLMGILDARLAGREWIVGSDFTFADLVNATTLGFATMMGGMSIAERPNVQAWLKRCQSRPAFSRAMTMQ